MITHDTKTEVERVGVMAQSGFAIKASAKAFDILSSHLYSDKIKAIVRELSCNAWDAHIAAGKHDLPIEIHLPTYLDPTFYVKDYGTGLSHEQIAGYTNEAGEFVPGLYQTFFDSTKNDSNEFIGALGLGSKSPFSYTNQFIVESRHNGMKRTYTAFKNEENLPCIALMGESETEEDNGMMVSLSVKKDDIDKFFTAAKKALMYFNPLPNMVGQSGFKPYDLRHTVEGSTWRIRESEYYAYMSGPYVVQGFVAYPILTSVLTEQQQLSPSALALCEVDIDLFVPIGDVDVAPSREALSYDKRTIQNLIAALEHAAEELRTSFQKAVDECKTWWEVALFMDKMRTNSSDKFKAIFKKMHVEQPFMWNGKEISQDTTIDMSSVKNTTLRTAYLSSSGKKVAYSNEWSPGEFAQSYEFTIQGALTVLIDHEAKPKSDIIRQYLADQPKVNGHAAKVIIIRPTQASKYSEAEALELVKQLGCPEFKFVRDLKYKASTSLYRSGQRRDKQTKLVWSGYSTRSGRYSWSARVTNRNFSRLTWTPTTIDMSEGGIYVDIYQFSALNKDGQVWNEIDYFIDAARKIGVLAKDARVVGLNEKELKQAKKDHPDKWVNIFDEVAVNFELANENDELVNRSVIADTYNELANKFSSAMTRSIFDEWDNYKDDLNDCAFKRMVNELKTFETTAANVDRDDVNTVATEIGYSLSTTDLVKKHVTDFERMYKMYNLFPVFDWSRFQYTSYRSLFIQYINSVDI